MTEELGTPRNDLGKTSARGFEVRLGMVQVVALFGAMVGFTFGSFYLGFLSGRSVGFEVARHSSSSEVAKLPVPLSAQEGEEEATAEADPSRIYAKLNDSARIAESASPDKSSKGKAAPAEKTIPEPKPEDQFDLPADTSSPDESLSKGIDKAFEAEASKDAATATDEGNEHLKPEAPQPTVRVLGDSGATGDSKTLGMLLDERIDEARKNAPEGTPKLDPPAAAVVEKVAAETTPTPKPQATSTPLPKATPAKVAVEKEAPTQNQGTVKGVLPSGWFAQVAAPKKLPEAQQVARQLKKSGFAVMIESASVRGEDYYRVVVGPEQSKVQADRLVDQLRREGVVSGQPFVRRVR